MPTLELRLDLNSSVTLSASTLDSEPPPGTLDFSQEENSALLILLEDD
ncbi:hypothetical protein [Mesorhizobium sp. M1B.F.Ca.ET.045.04.1.1]|nr:hypothetical protein [Mesorhizobium sp. M1B.F.Ca.ET.045.04.1.1]